MVGTAVVLSGIPATTLHGVMRRLSADFAQGYVFRARPAPLSRFAAAQYTSAIVDGAISNATDAVFGNTRRALSFCRNPSQPCAKSGDLKKTCGLQAGQSCMLERPDRLLLFYQEGHDEAALRRQFYHSAFSRRIPAAAYGDVDATVDEISAGIRDIRARLDAIEREFTTRRTPLLLPPKGFRTGGAVVDLITKIEQGADPSAVVQQFRQDHWRQDGLAFESGQRLLFRAEEKHGIAGPLEPAFALSATYRLGCVIAPGFHWNVTAVDGKHLSGRTIDCRAGGAIKITDSHVNLFADDRIR